MGSHRDYAGLLEKLGVQTGDTVFVHTSYSRLSRVLDVGVDEIIEGLVDRVGSRGTVVMPSFAWNLDRSRRPWAGYAEYFSTPRVFDVRKTPANIGVVPERFRHRPDVQRSASYWWPVCAVGAKADEVTCAQEAVEHPYGPGSSFHLLRELGVKMVGLGVSLNTNSLALTPDWALGSRHPHDVFTPEPRPGRVVDRGGHLIETRSTWLLPDVVRLIKPSAVIESSPALAAAVARADLADAICFCYAHERYHAEAVRLGEDAVRTGQRVPWLKDYRRRDEASVARDAREEAGP